MPNPTVIAENIHLLQQQITEFAKKYDRSAADIQLLAVSKTRPVEEIEVAYKAGQQAFGEN